MKQIPLLALLLGTCAVLLIVGFVFSVIVTDGISAAAQREATQHAAVPTPAALAHGKSPAPAARPAPAHA